MVFCQQNTANEQAKIEIYKKLRKTETFDQIIDIKDELIDRFNDYPVEVARLLDIVEIKVHTFIQVSR